MRAGREPSLTFRPDPRTVRHREPAAASLRRHRPPGRERENRMFRNNGASGKRAAIGAIGGLMLLGVGGAAFADEVGGDDVDLDVTIEERQDPGALSLSVAGDSETLTEVEDAAADHREATGGRPDGSVADTRPDVPGAGHWYVTGQAGDFVGSEGQESIAPDHLGCAPELVTDGNGEVAPRQEAPASIDDSTDPAHPDNVGL